MNERFSPLWALLFGILLSGMGVYSILTGDGFSRGGIFVDGPPAPGWTGWILLPAGLTICILSIRALRRGAGKTKPKQYTDEDAARAKEEMDRLYLKEHGSLPEEPRPKKGS